MHSPLPTTGLIAHRKALDAAGIAISLVMRVPAPLKSIAYASAKEVDTHLRLLVGAGAISAEQADTPLRRDQSHYLAAPHPLA